MCVQFKKKISQIRVSFHVLLSVYYIFGRDMKKTENIFIYLIDYETNRKIKAFLCVGIFEKRINHSKE